MEAAAHTPREWPATLKELAEPLASEMAVPQPMRTKMVWVRNDDMLSSRGVYHVSASPLEEGRIHEHGPSGAALFPPRVQALRPAAMRKELATAFSMSPEED